MRGFFSSFQVDAGEERSDGPLLMIVKGKQGSIGKCDIFLLNIALMGLLPIDDDSGRVMYEFESVVKHYYKILRVPRFFNLLNPSSF